MAPGGPQDHQGPHRTPKNPQKKRKNPKNPPGPPRGGPMGTPRINSPPTIITRLTVG